MIEADNFLLNDIHVHFDHKVDRQVQGIPIGTNYTNCTPVLTDVCLSC